MDRLAIGVVGAGAIGRAHAELIAASDIASLAAVADPAPAARELALRLNVPWYDDHRRLLDEARPQALIVATPNDLHAPVALDALVRGIACLVEKPIAANLADASRIAQAAADTGAPVLVGHHRRHNPIIREARRLIASGAIGAPVSLAVLANMYKPDDYFAPDWRRRAGAGPVLVNLIHEIDLVRFLVGEIATVQAITSNARRGFEVEDTAAVVLRLDNGALATLSLSDAAASPWSWDLSSGELPNYPPQPAEAPSHFLCGSEGSLSLPRLDLWRYRDQKSWFAPLSVERIGVEGANPYVAQLQHLCRVARGEEKALVDAADGLRTLRATLAVHEFARTGQSINLGTT